MKVSPPLFPFCAFGGYTLKDRLTESRIFVCHENFIRYFYGDRVSFYRWFLIPLTTSAEDILSIPGSSLHRSRSNRPEPTIYIKQSCRVNEHARVKLDKRVFHGATLFFNPHTWMADRTGRSTQITHVAVAPMKAKVYVNASYQSRNRFHFLY